MDMWVFGYGSLLWNPGFDYVETALARLEGYQRSFCMRSIHHRGTVEDPGLVLALDQTAGGSCDGLAFRVAKSAEATTLAYLRERELVSSAYLEKTVPVALRSGQSVAALTYVIDPGHVQYCGSIPLTEQAQIIAAAKGGSSVRVARCESQLPYLGAVSESGTNYEVHLMNHKRPFVGLG